MKQKHFLSLLFMLAALLSGCSSSDDLLSEDFPGDVKTYTATVYASKDSIEGLGAVDDMSTRAIFVGGNSNGRYGVLWDKGDVVQVYKDGAYAGKFSLDAAANEKYQGSKEAYLSGTLTGSFAVNDDVNLFLTPKAEEDLSRTYTGQKGSIYDVSAKFSYQKATVKVDEVNGSNVKLGLAAMWHRQAYLRFVLTDQAGNRLHPSMLTITTPAGEELVTAVAADGTCTYGSSIVISPEAEDNEYPGELFVALLNKGFTESATSGTNGSVTSYQLTAIVNGETYVFPGPNETQNPIKVNPTIGRLTKIARKLTKQASSTTTTATLGDMDGQQGFGDTNKGATLGDMEGQEDL